MGTIHYDVPMIRQEQNPICWIACVAMIASFKSLSSVGIRNFTGGFDPSNSCIPDPVNGWQDFYNRLNAFGFTSINPNMCPAASYVEDLLRAHGPFMLTHYVSTLPYGPAGSQQATAQATVLAASPDAVHAVVITGVNTDTGIAKMNNPWGDKDQNVPLSSVLMSMETLFILNIRSVAYKR